MPAKLDMIEIHDNSTHRENNSTKELFSRVKSITYEFSAPGVAPRQHIHTKKNPQGEEYLPVIMNLIGRFMID